MYVYTHIYFAELFNIFFGNKSEDKMQFIM